MSKYPALWTPWTHWENSREEWEQSLRLAAPSQFDIGRVTSCKVLETSSLHGTHDRDAYHVPLMMMMVDEKALESAEVRDGTLTVPRAAQQRPYTGSCVRTYWVQCPGWRSILAANSSDIAFLISKQTDHSMHNEVAGIPRTSCRCH